MRLWISDGKAPANIAFLEYGRRGRQNRIVAFPFYIIEGGQKILDLEPLVVPHAVDEDEIDLLPFPEAGKDPAADHVDAQRGPFRTAHPVGVDALDVAREIEVRFLLEVLLGLFEPRRAETVEFDVPEGELLMDPDPFAPAGVRAEIPVDSLVRLEVVLAENGLLDAMRIEDALRGRIDLERLLPSRITESNG